MSADDKALIAQMRQEIAELKEQTRTYRAGDVVTFPSPITANGYLTNAMSLLHAAIYLDKRIDAKGAKITFSSFIVRSIDGNLAINAQNTSVSFSPTTGKIDLEYITGNSITMTLSNIDGSKFGTITKNSTPVSCYINGLKIEFTNTATADQGWSEGPGFDGMGEEQDYDGI